MTEKEGVQAAMIVGTLIGVVLGIGMFLVFGVFGVGNPG